MGKRLVLALLSILISILTFIVNLIGLGLSYIWGKEWKLLYNPIRHEEDATEEDYDEEVIGAC
tara:strand:+ start:43 stop:231 length:189 start_codon:yes stop_codon:yes gene_type:complete